MRRRRRCSPKGLPQTLCLQRNWRPTLMSASAAIQQRCSAVLKSARASDELKAVASIMLRTGEPSRKAKIAGGIASSGSNEKTTEKTTSRPVSALANPPAAAAAVPAAASSRALPTDLDDADADAFAAVQRPKRPKVTAAPPPAAFKADASDDDDG